MATDTLEATERSRWSRFGSVLLHEFREVIPPTLFFFLGFNLVLFTKRLFLEQYKSNMRGYHRDDRRADRRQGGAHRGQDALPAPL